jgi:hypothetical protein
MCRPLIEMRRCCRDGGSLLGWVGKSGGEKAVFLKKKSDRLLPYWGVGAERASVGS